MKNLCLRVGVLTGLVSMLATMTASAGTIIDTGTPVSGGHGNLKADAGQTFTTGVLGAENKLATIAIYGPELYRSTDAPKGPYTLEIWTDADGNFATWGLGTKLGTSDSQSFSAKASTTFTFASRPVLLDSTVYAFRVVDSAGQAIQGRWGFTNDGDALSNGALFEAGSQPFKGAYDSAMQISTTSLAVGVPLAPAAPAAPAATPGANVTGAYSTSFEELPTGTLKTASEGGVVWNSLGQSEISTSYHKTGSKCLRMFGGTDNTLEILLGGALQGCLGVEFDAERWSSTPPFSFRIDAQVDGVWKEVANCTDTIIVGRGFRAHIVAKLPAGKKTALRLVTSAPADKGTLIDDFKLLKEEPTNVTKVPEVAKDPIARLIQDELLFQNGTTHAETIMMADDDAAFTNHNGGVIMLNGGGTLQNRTAVYRIPALITAANGDLIAVCDARRDHGGDLNGAQDIDIAVRRSSDNGATWSDMEIMCDLGEGHPASDPSLVLDETTGEIFCFYNYMDRSKRNEYRLYLQSSKDNGKTWGAPRDITDEMTLPEWKWDFKFMTSGRGCQTRDGELLHNVVRVGKGLHLFGSKDHGKTWELINEEPMSPADESKVIELADGRLMVNARVNGYGTRHVHTSEDGGKTWTGYRESQLVDPGCNGAIIRYTAKADGYEKNRLIFSNANSFSGRKNLAVRISYDEGKTWSDGKVITPGGAMYSDLTICPDGSIGILYEPGNGVRFTSITLEDLTDGKDKLSKPYKVPGSATE